MNDIKNASDLTGIRHMITLPEQQKEKLKKLSKDFHLTQGEIVDVLLEQIDLSLMGQHFEARRNGKLSGRSIQTDLIKKMKGLSQEQIAAIQSILSTAKP
jgi:hypothetical protein